VNLKQKIIENNETMLFRPFVKKIDRKTIEEEN
jgi:hypothetical protein